MIKAKKRLLITPIYKNQPRKAQLNRADLDNETHERFYEHSEIYLLKDISYEHYLSICRKMLYSILNTLHRQGQDTLVLDQFLSDCGYDTTLLHTLLPELRQIVVWRDPRDLYSIATRLNVQWMAHDSWRSRFEASGLSYTSDDQGQC